MFRCGIGAFAHGVVSVFSCQNNGPFNVNLAIDFISQMIWRYQSRPTGSLGNYYISYHKITKILIIPFHLERSVMSSSGKSVSKSPLTSWVMKDSKHHSALNQGWKWCFKYVLTSEGHEEWVVTSCSLSKIWCQSWRIIVNDNNMLWHCFCGACCGRKPSLPFIHDSLIPAVHSWQSDSCHSCLCSFGIMFLFTSLLFY